MIAEQIRIEAQQLIWPTSDDYDKNNEHIKKARAEYRESINAIEEKFEKLLADEYGLTKHSKRHKVFEMAWEKGHSTGYESVEYWYEELAALVK